MNGRNGSHRESDDSTDTNDVGYDSPNSSLGFSFDEIIEQISEDAINAITFGEPEGSNGYMWPDIGGQRDNAPDGRSQAFRPIIRTSSESIRSQSSPTDWYQQFVDQTNRFAEQRHSMAGRHVRFRGLDEEEEEKPLDTILPNLGNLFTPMSAISDLSVRFNFNARIEERSPPGFSPRLPPWLNNPDETLDRIYNDIIRPAANNIRKEEAYFRSKWDENYRNIENALSNTLIFGNNVWAPPTNENNSYLRFFSPDNHSEGSQSHIQKLMAAVRKSIPKTPPTYTWSGQLPRKSRSKTPIYSCKVFLGGIPYDLTDSDLHCTFAQFGHIQIQWPGKDIKSAIDGAAANKAGYVYIVFESYDNVAALLSHCTVSYRDMDSGCRWYFNVSSRRQKGKEVQVIPFDIGDRFHMKSCFSGQMEHSRTVFVGALHGMLSADGLAKVMDDLFGGVVFAGLDTDKFKYPLGSGRVSFDNQESYLKAVNAAFVEIKSARFKKKIQIDPYIDNESVCTICRVQQSTPIFCRDDLLYFCAKCWDDYHSNPELSKHRPIIKNKANA